jgi:hypothetical protein
MEKNLRVMTIEELMRLTRSELCALYHIISVALVDYPAGASSRAAICRPEQRKKLSAFGRRHGCVRDRRRKAETCHSLVVRAVSTISQNLK